MRAGLAAEHVDGDGQRQPVRERDAEEAGHAADLGRVAQDGGNACEAQVERSEELCEARPERLHGRDYTVEDSTVIRGNPIR